MYLQSLKPVAVGVHEPGPLCGTQGRGHPPAGLSGEAVLTSPQLSGDARPPRYSPHRPESWHRGRALGAPTLQLPLRLLKPELGVRFKDTAQGRRKQSHQSPGPWPPSLPWATKPLPAGQAHCHPSVLPRQLEDGGGGTGKPRCLQPQARPPGSTGHQPRPNVPPKGHPVPRAGRGRRLSWVSGSESARWVTQQGPCTGAPGKAPDGGPRDRTPGGLGRRVPTAELHKAPIYSKHPVSSKPTPQSL